MNYLARKIGIFCNTKEWGDSIFKTIKDNIPKLALKRVSPIFRFIEFVDGSTLRVVSASDSSRGNKFNEIYIQEGVPREVYECVISRCIFPQTARCAVIRNVEDIAAGHVGAKEYYYPEIHEAYDAFISANYGNEEDLFEQSQELDDFISGFTVRDDSEEV